MVYTVGGIKGGSGKTTVATNLAVWLAKMEGDVLLVDADDQESATDFTAWREEATGGQTGYTAIKLQGDAVLSEVRKLKDKYRNIVIDTGGRDTTSQRAAIAVADIFLLPFAPRAIDIWTIEKTARLVAEMKPANPTLKVLTFINKADPAGSDNEDAAKLLRDNELWTYVDAPLGERKAFANAVAKGLGIAELTPRNEKAIQEFAQLWKNIINVDLTLEERYDNVKVM